MGVDGSEYTPGEIWGHVNIEASTLTTGDHEFDVLLSRRKVITEGL